MTLTRSELGIRDIRVRGRHRRDVGNLDELKASMAAIGLLHPIVIDEQRRLLAGQRRLMAARALGWPAVPVRIVKTFDDAIRALVAERDENTCRKAFAPSEAVALAQDLAPLERAAAKRRTREAGRIGGRAKGSAKLADPSKGESRDKIATAVGVPRTTLAKATAVVEAAKQDPELIPVRNQMDRTGNVNGAYRMVTRKRQADALKAAPPPLPDGPFDCLVVDPPWPYASRANDVTHRVALPYPELTVEAICQLPIAGLAKEHCILWLWTTNAHMRESYAVLDAWGFAPKTILTWGKQKFGAGNWLRGQTEHCHLAVKGKPTVQLANQSTLLLAPAGAHSAKPDEFYELVKGLCPGSKVELFARQPRSGFIPHGNAVSQDR